MSAESSQPKPLTPEEERRWAATAWAVSGPFGPIIPAVIYAAYRRRSAFVAWHALQAACSYVFLFAAALLMGIVAGVAAGVAIANQGGLPQPGDPVPPAVMWTSASGGLVVCGVYVTLIVAAFVFAIRARRGELARYPFVNRLAAGILAKQVREQQE